MFLLRGAFGLALIVMLLPTDESNQAKVIGTAGAAVERAATFCERNVQTCAAGAELWVTFVKKAEFGARLAGSVIQDWMRNDSGRAKPAVERASAPHPARYEPKQTSTDQGRGTLTPRDLGPAWRGVPQKI